MGLCVSVIETESPEFQTAMEISTLTSHPKCSKSHSNDSGLFYSGFIWILSQHLIVMEGLDELKAPGTVQSIKDEEILPAALPESHQR